MGTFPSDARGDCDTMHDLKSERKRKRRLGVERYCYAYGTGAGR